MGKKESLQEFADLINAKDDWDDDFNDVIVENDWLNDLDENTKYICRTGDSEPNDQGLLFKDTSNNVKIATVVPLSKYVFHYSNKKKDVRSNLDNEACSGYSLESNYTEYIEYDGWETYAIDENQAWIDFLSYDGTFGIADENDYTCEKV
jgi:hypothetical protein